MDGEASAVRANHDLAPLKECRFSTNSLLLVRPARGVAEGASGYRAVVSLLLTLARLPATKAGRVAMGAVWAAAVVFATMVGTLWLTVRDAEAALRDAQAERVSHR